MSNITIIKIKINQFTIVELLYYLDTDKFVKRVHGYICKFISQRIRKEYLIIIIILHTFMSFNTLLNIFILTKIIQVKKQLIKKKKNRIIVMIKARNGII